MLDNYKTSQKTVLLIIGIAIVVCISSLVLSQGGYYAAATAIVGIFITLLCILAIVFYAIGWLPSFSCNEIKRHLIQIVCFLLVAVCYVVSMFVNGVSVSSLSASLPIIVALATLFLMLFIPSELRLLMKKWLCYIGIAFAIFGLFICSGSVNLSGTFVDNRLYFTFQYANAAAVFFLVITLLCLLSENKRLSKAWIVPAVALFRTQSMAAVGIFFACLIIYIVVLLKRKDFARASHTLIGLLLVFVLFALGLLIKDSYAFVPFLLTIAVWIAFDVVGSHFDDKGSLALCIILAALLVISLCAVATLISGRLEEASRTIIVRLMQNIDAVKIILMSPIIGTGPDSWSYLYPTVQSAQYSVSVVHNSFAQVAIDAGLIALLSFLIFIVLGIVDIIQQYKKQNHTDSTLCALLPVLAFLVHCFFDFDLCYSSLLLLLVVMLSPLCVEVKDDAHAETNNRLNMSLGLVPKTCLFVVAALITLSCGCFSIFELQTSSALQQYEKALKSGDVETIANCFFNNSLITNDSSMQEKYLQALCNAGQNEKVIEWNNNNGCATGKQSLHLARAYYQQGNIQAAENVIADTLTKYPFQYVLFEEAHSIVSKYDPTYYESERYQKILDNANSLTRQGYSALLQNQKDVTGA